MPSRRTGRRPVDPGALLATTTELPDGDRVSLRLTRPSDAPRVRAFLDGLSPETRRRRFFTPMPEIDERLVQHFTFYDPRERLVVAATAPIDGVEHLVGMADAALLDTGMAELAVVVADEHHGRGIGSLLGEAVVALASRFGVTHVKAEMLDHNAPMLRVMQRLGSTIQTVEDGNVVAYTRLPLRARRAA